MPKASPLPQQAELDEGATVPDGIVDGVTRVPARIPFEQALEELETIVQQMEDGTLTLERSLAAYRRGAELVKVCETALEHAKEQVRVLDGELLRPLSDLPVRGERP